MSSDTLLKVEDPAGTTLSAVQLVSGWSYELRIRVRGEDIGCSYRRGPSSGSIPLKAPEERDDWCNQVEAFISGKDKNLKISTGRYGRSGGSVERDADGSFILKIKSPRYSSTHHFRVGDADSFQQLISVLRSVG